MTTLLWVLIIGEFILVIRQGALNKKLDDIYTEVAEVHTKMGGWFRDVPEADED